MEPFTHSAQAGRAVSARAPIHTGTQPGVREEGNRDRIVSQRKPQRIPGPWSLYRTRRYRGHEHLGRCHVGTRGNCGAFARQHARQDVVRPGSHLDLGRARRTAEEGSRQGRRHGGAFSRGNDGVPHRHLTRAAGRVGRKRPCLGISGEKPLSSS